MRRHLASTVAPRYLRELVRSDFVGQGRVAPIGRITQDLDHDQPAVGCFHPRDPKIVIWIPPRSPRRREGPRLPVAEKEPHPG